MHARRAHREMGTIAIMGRFARQDLSQHGEPMGRRCNVKSRAHLHQRAAWPHPPECLEYVVVHELCHLLEASHGPRFKRVDGCVSARLACP